MDALAVGPDDEAAAAAVLADAFYDDPIVRWIYPDDAVRRQRFARLMARLLRVTRGSSRPLRSARSGGCALWTPPDTPPLSRRAQLRMIGEVPRFGQVVPTLRLLDHMDRQHPTEPHWYLFVVGSDPRTRGQGYGRAVIDPVLADCDRDGLPAYLESSNPDNVGYYERFGFRATGELSCAGSPPMTTMWRDPQ